MVGKVFGSRYEVTEKIGAGGMADVYKGVDQTLGRPVAIKVLHQRLASDATFAARFRQEAQAAANLNSPNIVSIYDWGTADDTYYIVMEYVKGQDLKEIIQKQGSLPAQEVAEIGAQVAAALAVAHASDVIHRDVKPHNIMVQADGTAKVMDFGIARAGNTTMTQTGSVLGTAHYVSPEQAQGKPLTAASDVYSLGVVLYEAATGKMPFDGDTPVAVALKQVNEQPVPPRQLNPAIPVALETVILKAMAKNPEARYPSAEAMRSDLLAVEAGRAISTTRPAMEETAVMSAVPGPVTRRGPQKKRSLAWLWILLVLLLIAGGFGAAYALGAFKPGKVSVPELVGMTQEEAQASLGSAQLAPGTVSQQFDATVEKGKVISQDPAAGTQVEKQTPVNIVVSKGIEQATIPDVVGMTEAEAAKAIQGAGFQIGLPTREFSTKPEGTVLKQAPAAGKSLAKGSTVNITVSKGQQLIEIPDVTGKGSDNAQSKLQAAGFGVNVNQEFSDTVSSGVVISQNPSGGSVAYKGTTVTITVSKGPNVVTVPKVTGLAEADAVSRIEGLGLTANVTFQDSTSMDGKVISQDPLQGTKVKPGTTIKLVVGKAPTPPPGP